MQTRHFHRTLLASAVLGVAAFVGAAGTASATPTLSIVVPGDVSVEDHREHTGDAGGTNYNAGYGTLNGPGVPSVAAGWPNTGAGLGPDPSFPPGGGGAIGTSGFHASYLELSQATWLTFQYMGRGDAALSNPHTTFGLDVNANGLFEASEVMFEAGVTTACAMFGGVVPKCDKPAPNGVTGVTDFNEYHLWVDPDLSTKKGRIGFFFGGAQDAAGNRVVLDNAENPGNAGNPDTALGTMPGYFLGIDPYQAGKQHQTSIGGQHGAAVYAGLSDRAASGDHDYQDLGVRISVPEPGGVALVLLALTGLAVSQRRGKRG